ncbi:hypothetical protein BGX27_003551 [Mortierella sp. AM989]|nr:hypothetical protein BGX27_003551 [Mortierella sp. AM989]
MKIAITIKESSWIKSAEDKSAEAYCLEFELFDKQDAHRRYTLLISDSNSITEIEKVELANGFDTWKKNKAD